MDNLGDWLYIVFLVVAVASGLFSGKKKKPQAAKPVQPRTQVETSSDAGQEKGFWEILEEMQNGPQQTQYRPKKVVEKKQVAVKSAKTSATPFLAGETIGSTPIQKQNNIILEESLEEDHSVTSSDFHLQDVDEIRRAIIYSEILNRKY